MRLLLLCLLSVLLLGSTLLQDESAAWAGEPELLQGDVLLVTSPCEVLADEPDTLDEELRTAVRLYQPPVTNDDRTEMFWAPEEPRLDTPRHTSAPALFSVRLSSICPRPLLRPPRLAA